MKLRTHYTQRYPTAPGVVLDMPFFEGSGLAPLDLSGKGNHGSITGATWTKDEKGPCLSFDGSDDYVDCGNDSSLFNDNGTWETMLYLAANQTASWGYMGCEASGLADGETWIQFESNTKLRMYLGDGSTEYYTAPAHSLALLTWYAVIATFGAAGMKLYVDSARKAQGSYTGGNNANTIKLAVGARRIGAWFFKGRMRHVRVYDIALNTNTLKRREEQPWYDYCRGS